MCIIGCYVNLTTEIGDFSPRTIAHNLEKDKMNDRKESERYLLSF